MKKLLIVTHLASLTLLLCVLGCVPIEDDGTQPVDTATENETDTTPINTDPRCADITDVEFDESCNTVLGFGVRYGSCRSVSGCEDLGYGLFESEEACDAECYTRDEACGDAGGTWDISARGGDYFCGQPPLCPENDCTAVPFEPGCNCGPGMRYDDALGCVEEPSCAAPSCDDTVGVEFGFGPCAAELGWMVRDGSCQLVKGCPNLDYGFYATRDACNAACNTNQRICMESGGAWMGMEDQYLIKSDFYYDCGTKVVSADPAVVACNCGPSKNFVAGVGCQDDSNCQVVNLTCDHTYDFDVDYTATPACPVIPTGKYGLHGGTCSVIFGCAADFQGSNPVVDSAYWFNSAGECTAACEPRCLSNDDCVDPDPDDEENFYCHFANDSNCGAFTNGGVCQASGGSCIQIYDPVCGCDGNNVSSSACITVTGRPMRHDGECFEFPLLNP